jgi:hypothetical protein
MAGLVGWNKGDIVTSILELMDFVKAQAYEAVLIKHTLRDTNHVDVCQKALGFYLSAQVAVELAAELAPHAPGIDALQACLARIVGEAHEQLIEARLFDDIAGGRVTVDPDMPE